MNIGYTRPRVHNGATGLARSADWVATRFTPNEHGGGSSSVVARLWRLRGTSRDWVAAPPGTETLRDAKADPRSRWGTTRDHATTALIEASEETP